MPIYAYRCGACGHARDVLQKLSDPLLTLCPSCNAEAFTKQVTAAGFQLKGSGWYATDFKDSGKRAAGPEAKTEDKAEPKGDTKADVKTDAKGEPPSTKSGESAASTDATPSKGATAPAPPPVPASGAS
jgi:putative FmdB family regulatory protein